ncbi:MAG: phosphotransferase [Oscillospiraceae bacterium]|nr:phosphotransferase [Oscillospiraceae bacterium]
MLDISNEEVLRQYLLDKGHMKAGEHCWIKYCGGGVSGTVAFVHVDGREMIVKQALAKLKVKEEWLCDPNRMQIEMKSNEIYHRFVPENTPEVYFYDHDNYIFGREAAPEEAIMWKSDLMTGRLDFVVAEKVMRSLCIVHNECAKDREIAEFFADKAIFYELRISPYIKFILNKHPQLTDYAQPIIEELMDSAITLVHGDYSPKNVMINDRKVYLMDFEVAHYGHPSFDLGFLSNHLVLKSIYNCKYGAAYLSMLRHILDLYFNEMDYMDKGALEQSFIKLLPLLMIARVDGKSPVEYLTEPVDKELVRTIAYAIIESKPADRHVMIDLILAHVEAYFENTKNA